MRLQDLQRINRRSIDRAGPRYMPGQDANAPNLQIAALTDVFEAIGLTVAFKARLDAMHANVRKAWLDTPGDVRRDLNRAVNNPLLLLTRINQLRDADATTAGASAERIRRCVRSVRRLTNRRLERLRASFMNTPPDTEARRTLDHQVAELQRFSFALGRVVAFTESPSFQVMASNALLVLGRWGTGKTHSLCDLARRRLLRRMPALLCLGQQLPDAEDPLVGICRVTGLATTPERLLRGLQRLGANANCRALLIVDAINEGDRIAWRRALPRVRQLLAAYPNVAIILSCRQPFDEQIVSRRLAGQFVTIYHEGFAEQEFNAQLSFFDYYGIPAPHFPLITEEFSRPLFLKLLCESIQSLSRPNQHRQLRQFACGQRGMTFLLERFIKTIGASIERDFRLEAGHCWRMLKGDSIGAGGSIVGVAPRMAARPTDALTEGETLDAIEPFIHGTGRRVTARRLLRRMLADGLLAEDVRWTLAGHESVFRFPYQRFGDHIIARHLLNQHLKQESEDTIRRSFYQNRPLGKIFELQNGGMSYKMPGLASALMVEFPERVRRRLPDDERELVFYLPHARQLVTPLRDTFLESLPWRSNDAFSPQTARIVNVLLEPHPPRSPNNVIEVLMNLATREGHVYSATKMQQWLARMAMAERDLLWSEYVRNAGETSIIFRLIEWIERNAPERITVEAAETSSRLLALLLTSTVRPLRDRVTRALFLIGLKHPSVLFSTTLDLLGFNDPYVGERLLAACYGVSMSLWADPAGQGLRAALPRFCRTLVREMFVPPAPRGTRHSLTRGYALGTIALGQMLDSTVVLPRQRRFLRGPFNQLPIPFDPGGTLADQECEVTKGAIHMDFGNYTLGTLVPGRENYDDSNPAYQIVRNQITGRIYRLGYSHQLFGETDRLIASYGGYDRVQDGNKTDRYGKKYSWIAYFELTGLRADQGLLASEWREPLRADVDVDPSFPNEPPQWKTRIADPFTAAPTRPVEWLRNGPVPDYDPLLKRNIVDGLRGPWVLLNGYLQQDADVRHVFTFLQGILVDSDAVDRLEQKFLSIQYPGNNAIPRPGEDHYTYGGEIPWSNQFGSSLRRRDGTARRNIQSAFGRWSRRGERGGVRLEVPAHEFSWSSSYSALNQNTGAKVPAPALCEAFGLVNHVRTLDLYDSRGRRASLYRRVASVRGPISSGSLLYMRRSLVNRYLKMTGQKLVWMVWGERGFTTASGFHQRADLRGAWRDYRHIHRRFKIL